MKKRVNVYAVVPVTTLKFPIAGNVRDIVLSVEEIRSCLFAKAKVEEILDSGKTVKLDFRNYDKKNTVPTSDVVTNQPLHRAVLPEEAIAKQKADEEKAVAAEAKAEEKVEEKVEPVEVKEEKAEPVKEEAKDSKADTKNNKKNKK